METNRLHQFKILVETLNLRKAAELLNISHSGLCKSLQKLEQDLDKKLYQQQGRGLIITDAGMKLYQQLEEILKQVEALKSFSPSQNAIKIGSFEVFTTVFMAQVIKEDLKNHEWEIHELIPGKMEEALINRKIDYAITYEPIPTRGIEFLKVSEFEMGIFSHSQQNTKTVMQDLPFISPLSPLEGTPSKAKGLDSWPENKLKRQVKFQVEMLETGMELTRLGLAVIFIPQFIAYLHNQRFAKEHHLKRVPSPKGLGIVKRQIYLAKRESFAEDRVIKILSKHLRRLREYVI